MDYILYIHSAHTLVVVVCMDTKHVIIVTYDLQYENEDIIHIITHNPSFVQYNIAPIHNAIENYRWLPPPPTPLLV